MCAQNPLGTLLTATLASVVLAGCGDRGNRTSTANLEHQVRQVLRLEKVSLHLQSDGRYEGRGVTTAGDECQVSVKRASPDEPLWFFVDDADGHRIMGPCNEPPPRMTVAEVIAAADRLLPAVTDDAATAHRFNLTLRDGVWDVARESPQNLEGGAAATIVDQTGDGELYYRLAEAG